MNPYDDDPNEHFRYITFSERRSGADGSRLAPGYMLGTTERGRFTIAVFNLNEPSLVRSRARAHKIAFEDLEIRRPMRAAEVEAWLRRAEELHAFPWCHRAELVDWLFYIRREATNLLNESAIEAGKAEVREWLLKQAKA